MGPMAAFVVCDPAGGGVELTGIKSSPFSMLWRKVLFQLRPYPLQRVRAEVVKAEAHHVPSGETQVLGPCDRAQEKLFFEAYEVELPVVRIHVTGFRFGRRND